MNCTHKNLQSDLSFDQSPAQIKEHCESRQKKVKEALDYLGTLSAKQADFKNFVLNFELLLTEYSNQVNPVTFLKYVSPHKDVREAADVCETSMQKFMVDIYTRFDLFERFKWIEESNPAITANELHLLKEHLIQFKRNGLELSPEKKELYTQKKKRLIELESQFSKALVEWEESVTLTPAELEGMPESYIKALKKDEKGDYRVDLDYPHYFPFMENGKNAEARRKLQFRFDNRGGEKNRAYLQEAIQLRHELAQLLGYPTHAAFVLDRRMAKEPKKVEEFLDRLNAKLQPKGKEDLKVMGKLKQKDVPGETAIHSWDWRYYENQLKKTQYQIDNEAIREYFPMQVVLKGMFEIYQTLLGVTFEESVGPVWHESVKRYAVKEGGNTLAYFYLDLYPRTGKYEHAAAFTLLSGFALADGGYFKPRAAMVANFKAPTADQPSLLAHSEVETLFHEFGHLMHQVLTKARFATFSGTSVKTDYVEAPSQMLENWVWDENALKKLSGHYQDVTKPLPSDLIQKMIAAKLANSGIRYLRQLTFAKIDMAYHQQPKVDTTAIYKKYSAEVMLIPIQEGTMPEAGFGHLMGGYDSGYYGYLWSEVFAQDMFTRFEKEGVLNPKVGIDYRRWILEQGGEQEPFVLIKGFLGREPNEEAFLKSLGISRSSKKSK